jgi:hypothetical protein
MITVFAPWDMVAQDFLGPISPPAVDGSRYIYVAVDYMCRFVLARPIQFADGPAVMTSWMYWWSPIFGWPLQVYSDNGSHFANEPVENMFKA